MVLPSLARRASIMREGGRLCRGNPAGVPLALAAEILQIYPQREAALLSVNLEEKLKAKPYRFRGGRFNDIGGADLSNIVRNVDAAGWGWRRDGARASGCLDGGRRRRTVPQGPSAKARARKGIPVFAPAKNHLPIE